MQTNHANALRGLSIAVVIIAGLAILACVIGFVFLGVGGSYLANMSPDMWEYYLYDGDYYDYGYDYYGVDGSDMAAIMGLLIGIGGFAIFWELLLSAVSLVAGILGLRNYNNPAKLGLVFGWSLAGAICALLTGNMVTMVLLIVMCVFAHKDKQLAAVQPAVIAQPMQPVQPVVAAPVTAAPAAAAPMAQPVQPVAQPAAPAAQPVTPAQPVETVQAVAVETVEAGTPITESAEPAAEPSALVQEEALEAAEEAKAE